ncbi:hypothetical protein H7J88_21945 [Mycolicibacterium flavescens]|uniref:Secreted protein n=1 Tax=Mycolicibacterium flavescens TaxID=1776 RepID=A0A1E3RI04_MYCFV|nr:DUF6049 family protein [Mycolicibacterium flavescens]MCV7282298.1 hypothetical protein [Mycolicibacterium flavescens]ODQ89469.1 hypothetical protein BHQ18_13605 [Mycolicibacterium flavescens]
MTPTALLRLLAALLLLTLTAVPLAVPPTTAAQPSTTTPFLQVRIDAVSPDVVTTTSEPVVTVTGAVLNVGDRAVRDVVVRLEDAAAVTTTTGLRTNLAGNVDQFEPVADFVTLTPELARGQEVPFVLSYPLRSAQRPSLSIEEPGVYPVMVNVNGTPDYGAPARLDDARFLLPVLGVPPDPAAGSADTVTAVEPPDTSRPVQLTVLWPIADRPRLAAGAPGGATPVRLIDDELATSLAPGGRLDTLLSAVEFATRPEVDADGRVRMATCLAIDPDLLVTVNAMTGGYVVNDGPDAGPGTPTRPGTGQQAAVGWLNRLKELAKRICAAPTPYAQADLDALRRVGDPGLTNIATNIAGDIVDQILGIASVRGATLIADGPLTGPAVRLLSAQGPTVAIAAGHTNADGSDTASTADTAPVRYTPNLVAAPFDPAVGAALAGAGAEPSTPGYLDPALDIPLRPESEAARRQSALGALLWRGLNPDVAPRTQIVVPPLAWNLRPDDAGAMFSAVATAINAGLAQPRPLTAVIAEGNAVPPDETSALPGDEVGDPSARFDDAVVSGIAAVTGRLWGLTSALTTDARTGLTGIGYTAPLREDMLRALSQSVPPDTRNGIAQQRLTTVGRTVDDMFNAVTIVNPGGSYTLATERSPLPLALRNDLPVPIRVRLDVSAPPGMTVTDMGEIELPPGFLPLRVPIEVHFTQRFAVDVSLRTADGLPLGESVRLSVHSNAYGKVLFFITLSAGAVLVLLAGRRLWHRFRGQPDPADLDRPDPLDVALRYDDSGDPVLSRGGRDRPGRDGGAT